MAVYRRSSESNELDIPVSIPGCGGYLLNLELFTEVSEIDRKTSILSGDLIIPGLEVRCAKTTIELGDAQSFAIADLLQECFADAVGQFSVLGDVLVLVKPFRSTEFQTGQTELVMIVTRIWCGPGPSRR